MIKIEKEELKTIRFKDVEVLSCPDERNKRFKAALKARKLGNLEKEKVQIYFKGQRENYRVDTTVWDVDSSYITLKYALTVPMKSIYAISF